MKKLLIAALAALCLSGCVKSEPDVVTYFVAPGNYYASGEVVTEDGNVWGYSDDLIGDNEPVYAIFCDAGTPDCIYDDEIVGLVGKMNNDIARVHE